MMTLAEAMRIIGNPKNVSFKDALRVAEAFFGEPRISASHHIFKTPWPGDPRVNLQKDGKMAKPYQVRQLQKAILRKAGEETT